MTGTLSGVGRLAIGAALAGAALTCGTAHAQLSRNRGPIAYSADNLEYNDHDRRMVLTGNVDVLQNDARLQANKLTLYFRPSVKVEPGAGSTPASAPASSAAPAGPAGPPSLGSGDIERMVAEGDVHVVRPSQKARGDQAVYEASTDTVTFTGNVVISSDENVIRGETLVMEIGSGRSILKPAEKPGERVRGVLRPKGSQSPGG
jgi:lipopolysaccharide export system protein LptA